MWVFTILRKKWYQWFGDKQKLNENLLLHKCKTGHFTPQLTERQQLWTEHNRETLVQNVQNRFFFFFFCLFCWSAFKSVTSSSCCLSSLSKLENSGGATTLIYWEQGWCMRWWERSPPTNMPRVRFSDLAAYVGWVCCWFSSLLREVFLRVL